MKTRLPSSMPSWSGSERTRLDKRHRHPASRRTRFAATMQRLIGPSTGFAALLRIPQANTFTLAVR